MRMLVMLTSLILLLPAVVAAQEEAAPRATIFGGYSYLRNSGGSSFNGWEGQGTFNFSRHFAIRAAQVDYLRTNFSSADALSTGLFGNTNGRQNSFRYSAGIVFRF